MVNDIKVACLGGKNSYTGQIARKLFADLNEQQFSSEPIVKRVIRRVQNQEANYGVIPVENRYGGTVRETFRDLRKSQGVYAVSEDWMKIIHCFGALRERGAITQIYSKDQALIQCEDWLEENYPEAYLLSVDNTEAAVRRIVENKLNNVGAIASREAILTNDLELLAEDLMPNNRTRFFVLGNDLPNNTGDDKTLLAVHPIDGNRSGILHDSLAFFKAHKLNLELIESAPDGNDGYYFYLETKGHLLDEPVQDTINSLESFLGSEVKVLGCYKNSQWKK